MTINWRIVTGVVVAALSGGIGGYFLGKKKGYEEGLDAAWEDFGCARCELNQFKNDRAGSSGSGKEVEKTASVKEKTDVEDIYDEEVDEGELTPEEQKLLDTYHVEESYTRYGAGAKALSPKDRMIENDIAQQREVIGYPGISSISIDDFADDRDLYKETLLYYEVDNVLADQDNEVIYDKEKYIGDFVEEVGAFDNGDSIYVRNEDRNTDYEVVLMKGSYAEQVLGVIEPEFDERSVGGNNKKNGDGGAGYRRYRSNEDEREED